MMGQTFGRRDMHGRGESIVGTLGAVYIIVRMNRLFGTALAAGQFDGAIGDHLVRIHIRLGAAARLPDDQREMRIQYAFDHFVRSAHNQLRFFRRKAAQLLIADRGRFFQNAQRANHFARKAIAADLKIL